MSRAKKRIFSDIKKLHNSSIHEHGIYFHYDEEDMFNMKIMMIGPEGTPYFGGAYFFNIDFPKTYPLQPPKVLTKTQGHNTRFNPNLYISGKVCLSMLNTWSGPGWTPCNTITSVLLSIQAMVLVKVPLKNEPGYETASKSTLNAYSSIIRYENIRTAILEMEKSPPNGYEIFHDNFLKEFMKNYDKIMEIVKDYSEKEDGKQINSTYNMSRNIDYKSLIPSLQKIYDKGYNWSKVTPEKEDIKSVNTEDNTEDNEDLWKITPELIGKMASIGKVIETQDSESEEVKFAWFFHIYKDQNNILLQDKNCLDELGNYSMSNKLTELREICAKYKIPCKKVSPKTGNMIWKLKSELMTDIKYLINKFT